MASVLANVRPTDLAYEKSLHVGNKARDRADSVKQRLDQAIVKYDAWFLVFVAVILALGATIAAGLAIWCVVKQNKTFTGNWSFKDFGLKVYFECK